jgi:hypothetical protein
MHKYYYGTICWKDCLSGYRCPNISTILFYVDGALVDTKTLNDGATLTDIPTVPVKAGNTGVWNKTDFSNITVDTRVDAQYSQITRSVTFYVDGSEIDQKVVNDGDTLTDIPTVPAKLGYEASWDITGFTNITSSITVGAVYDLIPDLYTITVANVTNSTVSIADGTQMALDEVVEFTVTPALGFEIDTITINGELQTIVGESYSVTGDEDKTITVRFKAIKGVSTIVDGSAPATIIDSATPENNFITTFATVTLIPEDQATAKFGILFAVGEKTDTELIIGGTDVTEYPALAAGTEGKFAVKLLDGGSGLITNQIYSTRTYLQVGTNEPIYGAVQVVNQDI